MTDWDIFDRMDPDVRDWACTIVILAENLPATPPRVLRVLEEYADHHSDMFNPQYLTLIRLQIMLLRSLRVEVGSDRRGNS